MVSLCYLLTLDCASIIQQGKSPPRFPRRWLLAIPKEVQRFYYEDHTRKQTEEISEKQPWWKCNMIKKKKIKPKSNHTHYNDYFAKFEEHDLDQVSFGALWERQSNQFNTSQSDQTIFKISQHLFCWALLPVKDTHSALDSVVLFVGVSYAQKGWGFDSQLEHTPRMWVQSPVGAYKGGNQSL